MTSTSGVWENATQVWRLFRQGDISKSPWWVKVLVLAVRVTLRSFEEFFNDKCLQRSSALAFASLLALVPVTAIFFFFLTKLEAFAEIQLRVEDFLFQNLIPTRTDVIQSYLKQYTQNVTVLGVFGIIALFVTAIFLFNNVEHTINDIWHAKKKRPFLGKFTSFWTLLTITPLLIGVPFYMAARLSTENMGIFSPRIVTYILNLFAFWFAYQFIPYTHVRFRAAIIGALVGASLWELAKGGFNWYISHMTSFDKIYGSLGAVPMFLLWLYLTWTIVLFGTEVAYAVQYPHPQGKISLPPEELENYLDFYAVRTMAEIVKRFNDASGGTASTIETLQDTGIPPEILGRILNSLAEKHLIVYTEDQDYVPARQPSRITVREVIEAVSGRKMLAPRTADDDISRQLVKTFEDLTAGIDSALDGLNLMMVIDGDKVQSEIPAAESEN